MSENLERILDARLVRHPLGFLQVGNVPSEAELKEYYADKYYQTEKANFRKTYPPEEIEYFKIKIQQRAYKAQQISSQDKGNFLDVGCGEGFALAWFKEKGWNVEGIDFSSAGLEQMNPSLMENFKVGNVFELLEEKIKEQKKYDLVWLGNVLEHVVDPVSLLRSLSALITKAGCLVVTVPNDGSLYQERLLKEGNINQRFWIAVPDHLAYFTYESLKNTSEETGWICHEIHADFPIDWFLLHPGSNYVVNGAAGRDAHKARVNMELLIGEYSPDIVNEFYCSMAKIGMGRSLTAFLTPNKLG
ncbi:class I SAM-dependent methyltransferase [Oxalicibacterium solurbis]|uniref:Class I SAM-dependent methyltransferase n=1 Tax=Oxalicibacterium solurbis TaxID=69280 RepID=A0A8J3AW66_9BURK|nr:class I SAM-dependent methyltransferase [Oxalicibacterium solurbis]GGI54430.1 hypothetical protein GCM10011430_16040 [Oxalicibacterium solurbis]